MRRDDGFLWVVLPVGVPPRARNRAARRPHRAGVELSAISLRILIFAVGEGLLGSPEMFIRGNGSTHTELRWFQPRSDTLLPTPGCVSVSVWWYRLLMLLWALWLALALLRWLRLGWENFTRGGLLRRAPKPVAQPPPLRSEGEASTAPAQAPPSPAV